MLMLFLLTRAHADKEFIRKEREALLDFLFSDAEPSRSAGWVGRGIVIIGGRQHSLNIEMAKIPWAKNRSTRPHRRSTYYTLDALMALAALRRHGCRLPVEIWHDHDPALLPFGDTILDGPLGSVQFRDITHGAVGGDVFQDFSLPALCLLHSVFAEVLYIDADVLPLADPTPLFETEEYLRTGAVFWSVWNEFGPYSHMFWQIFDSDPLPLRVDNAVMLLNRAKHYVALEMAFYLIQRWRPFFFVWPFYLNGDADMFPLGFLANRTPFHTVFPPADILGVATLGGSPSGAFCGHSVLIRHPNVSSEVVFVHRSRNKFSYLPRTDLVSNAVKRPRPLTHQGEINRVVGGDMLTCFDVFGSWDGRLVADVLDRSAQSAAIASRVTELDAELFALRGRLTMDDSNHTLRPGWWRLLGTELGCTASCMGHPSAGHSDNSRRSLRRP
mmetsp:Transcript_30854/g.89788  ORF Transcript_30854/g.89788 Transcript_30854/m.89788 type:complete len:443 (-) Transcript_30854:16-1344(-)